MKMMIGFSFRAGRTGLLEYAKAFAAFADLGLARKWSGIPLAAEV